MVPSQKIAFHSKETILNVPDQNTRLRILQVSTCRKILLAVLLTTFFGTLLVPFLSNEHIKISTSSTSKTTIMIQYSNTSRITNTKTMMTIPIRTAAATCSTRLSSSTKSTKSTDTSIELTTNLPDSTITLNSETTLTSEQILQYSTIMSDDVPEEYPTTQFGISTKDFSTIASTFSTTFKTSTMTIEPKNLLINPGAEQQFNGWTQGSSRSAMIESGGQLNKNYNCRSGKYCFAGGRVELQDDQTKIIQRINLLNGIQNFTEDQIDSGHLSVNISFYYQTFRTMNQNGDILKVDVSFHGSTGPLDIGLHTDALRCKSSNPGWCYFEKLIQLPSKTRFINYIVLFYKESPLSRAIDSYNDDNSLIIK